MTDTRIRTPDVAAIDYFARRLRFETDPSDVREAQLVGDRMLLVDVRSREAWDQGHAAGAVHIPRRELASRADDLDPDVPVIVYCWGPACNGGVRGALEVARLGVPVKEMIGGFEYWAREGLPVEDANGPLTRAADPLVAPVTPGEASCAC